MLQQQKTILLLKQKRVKIIKLQLAHYVGSACKGFSNSVSIRNFESQVHGVDLGKEYWR